MIYGTDTATVFADGKMATAVIVRNQGEVWAELTFRDGSKSDAVFPSLDDEGDSNYHNSDDYLLHVLSGMLARHELMLTPQDAAA